MTLSTSKAIATRTQRLSEAFSRENGRLPTVEELGALYSAEMREIASRSSRNKVGTGGFAHTKRTNPQALKEWQDKGRQNRVKKNQESTQKS
jgi:hypothetical protein